MRSLVTALLAGLVLFGSAALSRADDDKDKKMDDKKPEPAAQRGYLGIRFQVAEGEIRIDEVMPDSPAEKAGLKEGDVVVRVDKKEVKAEGSMREIVGSHKPGDKVTIDIKREGKEQTLEVTLGSPPADE